MQRVTQSASWPVGDKTTSSCRAKFGNFLNFRGFLSHIPGEDWLASYPVPDRPSGGARRVGGGGA